VALQLSAYRIVQESLTNVLKHAAPARAEVTVAIQPGAVLIDVEDDGTVEPSAPDGGSGIVGMRERVAVFDGVLTAGPRPNGGFAVHAELPRGGGG
jgi:signal transduction histidine kinase